MMASRPRSARTGGLKRMQSRTFQVDSDMISEVHRLEEFKGADAVLIVQQTGPSAMDFELRVEVSSSSRSATVHLELGQFAWLAHYLVEADVPQELQDFDPTVGFASTQLEVLAVEAASEDEAGACAPGPQASGTGKEKPIESYFGGPSEFSVPPASKTPLRRSKAFARAAQSTSPARTEALTLAREKERTDRLFQVMHESLCEAKLSALPPALKKAGILSLSELVDYTVSEVAEAVESASKLRLNTVQRRNLAPFCAVPPVSTLSDAPAECLSSSATHATTTEAPGAPAISRLLELAAEGSEDGLFEDKVDKPPACKTSGLPTPPPVPKPGLSNATDTKAVTWANTAFWRQIGSCAIVSSAPP